MTDKLHSLKSLDDRSLSPVIDQILAAAPSSRVLDLGCGDGRHARAFAQQGCDVVAIDASEDVLEQARAEGVPERVEFQLGDMGAVERLVRGHFGAAFCLGNTLPYLLSPESLSRMLIGLRRRLLPGAPFLLQILNYDRIPVGEKHALPLEMVEDPDGDLIVVRFMEARDDGIVTHAKSTLRYRPAQDPMMEVVDSQINQLRGWKKEELEIMLDVARFSPREMFGDMKGTPYSPHESPELVMVAA